MALTGTDDATRGLVLLVATPSVDPFKGEALRPGDRVLVATTEQSVGEWCNVRDLTEQYIVCVPDLAGSPGAAIGLEAIQTS